MLAFCLFSIRQKGQPHTLARHGQPEYSVDALDHALLRRSCRNEAGGGSVRGALLLFDALKTPH
jgi:hypothetical protein